MKNWKTTLSGVLAVVGLALQTSENVYVKNVGIILSAVGVLLIGLTAKDS